MVMRIQEQLKTHPMKKKEKRKTRMVKTMTNDLITVMRMIGLELMFCKRQISNYSPKAEQHQKPQ